MSIVGLGSVADRLRRRRRQRYADERTAPTAAAAAAATETAAAEAAARTTRRLARGGGGTVATPAAAAAARKGGTGRHGDRAAAAATTAAAVVTAEAVATRGSGGTTGSGGGTADPCDGLTLCDKARSVQRRLARSRARRTRTAVWCRPTRTARWAAPLSCDPDADPPACVADPCAALTNLCPTVGTSCNPDGLTLVTCAMNYDGCKVQTTNNCTDDATTTTARPVRARRRVRSTNAWTPTAWPSPSSASKTRRCAPTTCS